MLIVPNRESPMPTIRALILFPKSTSPSEVEAYLSSQLLPTVKRAGGVRSVVVSSGDMMAAGGPPPYAKVVEVTFASIHDVMAMVNAPENQAMKAGARTLGALILMYELAEQV
jgi:uncharacterized protein (DUF1330 family)